MIQNVTVRASQLTAFCKRDNELSGATNVWNILTQ